MRRVLLVQTSLYPLNGANQVAAWMLEALREHCDLTLLSTAPADWERVDRFYGTALAGAGIRLRLISARSRRLLERLPVPAAQLERAWLARHARRLDAGERFDVLISASNEMDFGRRGIQYVHFPAAYTPRPAGERRWYHGSRLLTAAYRGAARRLAGETAEGIRRNRSLVNSAYIGEKFSAAWGCKARVLYPPVLPCPAPLPWAERRDAVVCLGRLAPEKEIDKVVGVVEALRARGHRLTLHLVGEVYPRHAARIRALVERHAGWIVAHGALERPAVDRLLAGSRYGLHGMVGEHFGIGVAEMQRAGCIVFAPAEGGPAEILGGDERLLYPDAAGAVERFDAVLRSAPLRRELRAAAARRGERFSEQRFAAGLREIVEEFPES